MKKSNYSVEKQILMQAAGDPRYRGKQIVVIHKNIHILSTKSKTARAKLLISLKKKYPESTPLITYIPKEETLIISQYI